MHFSQFGFVILKEQVEGFQLHVLKLHIAHGKWLLMGKECKNVSNDIHMAIQMTFYLFWPTGSLKVPQIMVLFVWLFLAPKKGPKLLNKFLDNPIGVVIIS